MKLPFSFFLALRYLKPKRAFLSIITLISVAGVTLGITALIIVISVMTGFSDKLQESILGFEPHIKITSNNGSIADWREITKIVQDQPGVVAVAPYVNGPVIVELGNEVVIPVVHGIDPTAELKINDLKKFITEGKFDLRGDNVLIGSIMAQSLNAKVGDKISIISPVNVQGIIKELQSEQDDPKAKQKTLKQLKEENEVVLPSDLTVSGIFESGRFEYDYGVVLAPLNVGQELYELEDSVHGLSVRTTDQNTADRVAEELNTKLPRGVTAVAWMNGDDKSRLGAIKFERSSMFVILMIIVIVAAFCVMNTLITVTVQKRREIGILKALGANAWQIVWVFLAQGMMVGFLGNIIGLALGITLVSFRNEFKNFLEWLLHIEIFPQSVYEFSQLPARVVPQDVTVICISAFIICALAALIPAWFAARLDPVKALRYE